MLTRPDPNRPQRRRPRSLRQEYEEFIEEKIEEYKDQLPREGLLRLADEAVRELEIGPEEQLVLTEVLVLDHVDRLIKKRLRLPTYRQWRSRHLKLRQAQHEPTYWGLDVFTPLADLAQCLEEHDLALAVGPAAKPPGLFLAARDVSVLFIDQDLKRVEAAESRAATEALSSRFHALVVSLGGWFPDVTPALIVLDPAVLEGLDADARTPFLVTLKEQTISGGMHCVLPPTSGVEVISLATDTLQGHYVEWSTRRIPHTASSRWLIATKP